MNILHLTNYDVLIHEAKTSKDESEVASLWNHLLIKVGFDPEHGYRVIPQNLSPIKTKPDLIVKVLRSNEVVLVVECKCVDHDNIKGWDLAEIQVSKYMQAYGCPNGIAAVGHKCKFYHMPDRFIPHGRIYDFSHEFGVIFDIMQRFFGAVVEGGVGVAIVSE